MKIKRIFFCVLSLMLALQLFSCTVSSGNLPSEKETEGPYSIDVCDYNGNSYTLEKAPAGVYVSSPSAADIIVQLGCARLVKTCSAACKEIEGIPSGAKIASDEFVTPEMLTKQNVDTVIFSSNENADVELLKNNGFNVFVFADSGTITTAESNIRLAGAIFYKSDRAESIIDDIRDEISLFKSLASKANNSRKVYIEKGTADDYYAVGKNTLVNELVEILGAENAFKDKPGVSKVSLTDMQNANPEIIVSFIKDEDFTPSDIRKRKGFEEISACKNGKVFLFSKNFEEVRPSPSLVDSLNEMAEYIGII